MASLNIFIYANTPDTKKISSTSSTLQLSDNCSIFSCNGFVRIAGFINPMLKLKYTRVSRVDTELSEESESNKPGNSPTDSNKEPIFENSVLKDLTFSEGFGRSRRNIWKRFRGVQKVTKDGKLELNYPRNDRKNGKEQEPILTHVADTTKDVLGGADVHPEDTSVERCNFVLKQLERGRDDIKALRLFEWMRSNGKLKQNVNAYNLALRVLGRRGDWDGAEKYIQEMSREWGCELNSQVFNTLIYACQKRGLVELGAKWFRMMLENRVQPNVATFGMLMSLHQKGWNLEEAEFTFSQMRNCSVRCNSAYSAMITLYTRMRLYEKAEDVIGFLREDEVILNTENWVVVLNAYCQQGKLHEAELVMVSMREAGFSPNIVAFNTLITGYGRKSDMKSAQSLFQQLSKIGLEPDETTYRSMIEGWGRSNNLKEAERYYKALKHSGFKPNSSNLYTMINLQAKHGDELGGIKTLDDMISMGCQYSSVLGILLQAYERAGRFDKVPSVIKGSFYKHILTNQTSCSILVMAYVKHSLVDEAINILKNRGWEDYAFADNLYHLLICSCKELGHLDDAVKIYTHIPKSQKPNLYIMCTMIEIYSSQSLFTEAEELYVTLKSSGIALDMIAFSIVVRMYVKSGRLEDACAVIEMMEKQGNIVPDSYLLCDMFRIYQRCGFVDRLANLYYKMLKTGVAWDQEMYNCVINCCARALPVGELSRLFEDMLQHGFAPNTVALNVMLDVYGKSQLFGKARRVFCIAKDRGLVDVISYNTIISAYGRSKDLTNMSSMMREMKLNGFLVSLEAYNSMLDAYGKGDQMEKFRTVLQRMKESNCTFDHYTYNIMINIYGEQGWIDEVTDVLMELKESGLGPDLYGYNTLIKAYGIAGMTEDAVALVKEMRQHGIEPDRITYINLISALQRNGEVFEAIKWSLWMKQLGL